MAYSKEIANAVQQFFIDDDWKYDFDEENGVFRVGCNLQCKLGDTMIIVRIGETGFYSMAYIKIKAGEDVRKEVAEFITRANYGMKNGNFEMDFNDGELRYKSFNNCSGVLPSAAVIRDSLLFPALTIDHYGDALLAVIFGMKSPQEAIEDVEGN